MLKIKKYRNKVLLEKQIEHSVLDYIRYKQTGMGPCEEWTKKGYFNLELCPPGRRRNEDF